MGLSEVEAGGRLDAVVGTPREGKVSFGFLWLCFEEPGLVNDQVVRCGSISGVELSKGSRTKPNLSGGEL